MSSYRKAPDIRKNKPYYSKPPDIQKNMQYIWCLYMTNSYNDTVNHLKRQIDARTTFIVRSLFVFSVYIQDI